jgi:hypothetical protein
MSRELNAIPTDEQEMTTLMQERYGHLFAANSYGF